MKEPFSEEILSAYLDGELPLDERAQVEQRLARDPRAREKLDDFRRLSQIFSGMSRSELPASFSSEVLQLAERRMLIPDAAPRPARSRAREWLFAIAGSVAVAAVFLVVVQAFGPRHDRPELVVAENRDGRLEPAPVGTIEPRSSDLAMSADGGGQLESSLEVPQTAPPAASSDTSSVAGAASPRADESRTAGPQLAEIGRTIQESNQLLDHEQVPVVTVYVADRAAGLMLVQRVFEEKNVRPQTEADAEAAVAREKGGDDDALFVVAEPEQVIAAFSMMLERDHPSLRVEVEPPIEISDLDRTAQQRFDEFVRELSGTNAVPRDVPSAAIARRGVSEGGEERPVLRKDSSSAEPNSAAANKKKPEPSAKPAKQQAELTKSEKGAAEAPPAAAKDSASRATAGRQFRAPAPRDLHPKRGRSSRKKEPVEMPLLPPPRSAVEAAADAKEENPAERGTTARPSPPLVRLLIRIESESGPGSAPVGPAADKPGQ